MAEAVREHEAALGVGVVDLDRAAVGRGDDVARLDRVAARQVLGGAHDREQAQGQAQAGDRRGRLDHGGAPGHVELHLGHLRPRLQRDAAAVERDRLADVGERGARAGGAGTVVGEGDQRGFAIGALRDRRERAHAAREQPVAALDLHLEAVDRGGELPRVLAERGRIEIVRGTVLEIARAVRRLAVQRGLGDRALEIACARDEQALDRARLVSPLRL